jgi:RNA polymerase sigma factor for flagellar operon FliA
MDAARFLCTEYTSHCDSSAAEREAVIMGHLTQVNWIARRIHESVGDHVSLEDLVSAGIVGLIAAIDNFDPSFNVKLKTYAEQRIKGAIYDSLRALDWAPHTHRRRARELQVVISGLEQRLGRHATAEEIAADLGMQVEEYEVLLTRLQIGSIGSLEVAVDMRQEGEFLRLSSDADSMPGKAFERSELERILKNGIDRLPKIERTILSLYFVEELTLREIAGVVGLKTTRVCQLKAQALLRLRGYMDHYWPTTRGLS